MTGRAKWYLLCAVFVMLCVAMIVATYLGTFHLGAVSFILGGCFAAVVHLRARLEHREEWEQRERNQ